MAHFVRTMPAAIVMAAIAVGVYPSPFAQAADPPQPSKTGTYSTTFAQRSPLSSAKELAARLGEKKFADPADYDLTQNEFLVAVPDGYDPTKPMGLVLLLNYKDTSEPPTPALPMLAEKNLAFVALKPVALPAWVKVGLAVDAAHNMAQLYKIDPRRVYVFGFDEAGAGERALLAYPDVFSGGFVCEFIKAWRPFRAANGGMYKADIPAPAARQLNAVKSHALVLARFAESEQTQSLAKALKADGFRNVKLMQITKDEVHYPNYTTAWLAEVIEFLDHNAATAAKPAPAAPATMPARR